MAQWVRREHDKRVIDRAGEYLARSWGTLDVDLDRLNEAHRIVDNWRACHWGPMIVSEVRLRALTREVDGNALIAQRLKRLHAVVDKLAREPNMKLSQMQDMGGCRAIVSSMEAVDRLLALYRAPQPARSPHDTDLKVFDYVRTPKADGYRSVHVVGRYNAPKDSPQDWNGQRIEIQLRTRLQHAFATTMETATTFTRTPLKSGGGSPAWRRFFALVSSAFARREHMPPVQNTPENPAELVDELRSLERSLRVNVHLRAWTRAVKAIQRPDVADANWLLMILSPDDSTVTVTGFIKRGKARKALAQIERRPHTGDRLNVVLVSVPQVLLLRETYPNYFADTSEFLNALNDILRRN